MKYKILYTVYKILYTESYRKQVFHVRASMRASVRVCVCVRARARVCVCACVRACVRASGRACVRAYVRECHTTLHHPLQWNSPPQQIQIQTFLAFFYTTWHSSLVVRQNEHGVPTMCTAFSEITIPKWSVVKLISECLEVPLIVYTPFFYSMLLLPEQHKLILD